MAELYGAVEPSEEVRKAFASAKHNWRPLGQYWVSDSAGLVLQFVPGMAVVGRELQQWWQESIAEGCVLLPQPAGEPIFAGGACWLAAALPPQARQLTLDQMTAEHSRRLAADLAQLHLTVKPWPAFLPEGVGAYWSRVLQERLAELVLYRGIVRRRGCRTDIEGLFMENFESSYDRGQEAVNRLAYIDQKELALSSKNWSFWGLSPQEVFWLGEQPLFYGLWPFPGLDMLDLGLLMKSLLCRTKEGDVVAGFRQLWAAYLAVKGQVTTAEKHFFQVMWLFPEGYWYYARRYFLRQALLEKSVMEDELYRWQVSILKERRLLAAANQIL